MRIFARHLIAVAATGIAAAATIAGAGTADAAPAVTAPQYRLVLSSNLVADFHSDLARRSPEVSPFDRAAVLQPDGVGETRPEPVADQHLHHDRVASGAGGQRDGERGQQHRRRVDPDTRGDGVRGQMGGGGAVGRVEVARAGHRCRRAEPGRRHGAQCGRPVPQRIVALPPRRHQCLALGPGEVSTCPQTPVSDEAVVIDDVIAEELMGALLSMAIVLGLWLYRRLRQ